MRFLTIIFVVAFVLCLGACSTAPSFEDAMGKPEQETEKKDSSKDTGQSNGQNANFPIPAECKGGQPLITIPDATSKGTDSIQSNATSGSYAASGLLSGVASEVSKSVKSDGAHKPAPEDQAAKGQVTQCARTVIRRAIESCLARIEEENNSTRISAIASIGLLGAAAAAGPIALAVGGSATTVALASSTAAVGTTIFTNVQKEVPTTLLTPSLSNMVAAGKSYMALNPEVFSLETAVVAEHREDYENLWRAVLSACPSGVLTNVRLWP